MLDQLHHGLICDYNPDDSRLPKRLRSAKAPCNKIAHGEAVLSGSDAMAAADAVETRKATSRKGGAPSAPKTLSVAPRPRPLAR
jgi:hypothetical protein